LGIVRTLGRPKFVPEVAVDLEEMKAVYRNMVSLVFDEDSMALYEQFPNGAMGFEYAWGQMKKLYYTVMVKVARFNRLM
jgi:hypothetical protein